MSDSSELPSDTNLWTDQQIADHVGNMGDYVIRRTDENELQYELRLQATIDRAEAISTRMFCDMVANQSRSQSHDAARTRLELEEKERKKSSKKAKKLPPQPGTARRSKIMSQPQPPQQSRARVLEPVTPSPPPLRITIRRPRPSPPPSLPYPRVNPRSNPRSKRSTPNRRSALERPGSRPKKKLPRDPINPHVTRDFPTLEEYSKLRLQVHAARVIKEFWDQFMEHIGSLVSNMARLLYY